MRLRSLRCLGSLRFSMGFEALEISGVYVVLKLFEGFGALDCGFLRLFVEGLGA